MERTKKGSASADVCVTRISPCRCGKGISYASFLKRLKFRNPKSQNYHYKKSNWKNPKKDTLRKFKESHILETSV